MSPCELVAMQVYWPASSSCTPWKKRVPLTSSMCAGQLSNGWPSFTHLTIGAGLPCALHRILRNVPSSNVLAAGATVNFNFSVQYKKKTNLVIKEFNYINSILSIPRTCKVAVWESTGR